MEKQSAGGYIARKRRYNPGKSIIANILTGKKICIQNTEDASAIGAGYPALKAINFITNYSSTEGESKIIFIP